MLKCSRLIFILFVLFGLLTACNLTSITQNLEDNDTASIWTQTSQAVQTHLPPTPAATDTPIPPTLTNTPSSASLPQNVPDKSFTFKPGGTSMYIQEAIKNGETHSHLVQASEEQSMILAVASPNNDVFLAVKGVQDNQELLSATAQASSWVGTLPGTQEYLITLTTDNPDTYYFLTVEIPANIHFQSGSDSITIDGYIDVHTELHPGVMTRIRYLVHASEGQTMAIELNSPNLDHLSIGVYGQQDGQRHLAYHVKNSGGVLQVPFSQGYYIDVYSTGGVSTDFTLDVSIK